MSPRRPSSGVNTAADSSVEVASQLVLEEDSDRSFWTTVRIGTTRVCIIDTIMAERPSANTRPRPPDSAVAGRLWVSDIKCAFG